MFSALRQFAERTVVLVGVNGMNAMTKVMGFLILCIGVQFIVNGVLGIGLGYLIPDFLLKSAISRRASRPRSRR